MQQPKQPSHVRGNRIRCPKYSMCPLCYGCRAYSTHDLECRECEEENKKRNICNKELHKDDIIADFITRNKTEITDSIQFESANTKDNIDKF